MKKSIIMEKGPYWPGKLVRYRGFFTVSGRTQPGAVKSNAAYVDDTKAVLRSSMKSRKNRWLTFRPRSQGLGKCLETLLPKVDNGGIKYIFSSVKLKDPGWQVVKNGVRRNFYEKETYLARSRHGFFCCFFTGDSCSMGAN
jgi:hypothetical protein